MNFFAMPTLKKARACFRGPISIMPLRSLKVTFARDRIGIEKVGSCRRCAAVTTMSARPTSFFSTGVIFLAVDCAIACYAFLRFVDFLDFSGFSAFLGC
jgi:hypothetical protein